MPPLTKRVLLIGLFVLFSCATAPAQNKVSRKITIVAKKPTMPLDGIASMGFGATCRATSDAQSPYFRNYKPVAISDVLGAAVKSIAITSYSPEWKNREEIRLHVLQVLNAQASEFAPGIEWDEGVFVDVVGTIQFADGKKGAFEESAGHVCFNDYKGAVIFTRILPGAPR
jgi:hypothetical protein